MDFCLYNNIVGTIQSFSGLSEKCQKELQKLYPHESVDTLYSILCHEYQKKMKLNYGKTQSNRNTFWDVFQKGWRNKDKAGIIVRLAESYDIPPCLMAKVILQKYFDLQEDTVSDKKESITNINSYLKNTSLIADEHLAYEVFLCTIFDNLYSPLADTMRTSLGQQYEIRLYKEAVDLGLAFRNEEYLRKYGYDKTPDLKLEVPIAIDGIIINWIESKALFADEQVHAEYTGNQYLSYWNRFGPGLVIYWFGYVKTITEPGDKRIIIRDHLPKNITTLMNVSNKITDQ